MFKKVLLGAGIAFFLLPLTPIQSLAQDKSVENLKATKDNLPQNLKYRRSSIYTMMVDVKGRPYADTIKEAFILAPVPDKFNNHMLPVRTFDPEKYAVVLDSAAAAAAKKAASSSSDFGRSFVSNASAGLIDTSDVQNLNLRIDNYLNTNNVARDLVAKWFNRSPKGTFNMDVIGERGFYDASEMQANVAKASARGISALSDAGEELIGNTFVVVTSFNYVDKAKVAEKASAGLALLKMYGGSTLGAVADVASAGVAVAAKGYVVKTNSYLYRLVWNDSTAAEFYNKMWIDENSFDAQKKAAFDTTNLFKLEMVGCESAWADVQSSIFSSKENAELTRIATVRAVDAVIAKLQKKYEVFRTKTPLYTSDPLSAKIGLKEGLAAGDKFEVLEQTLDEKTGKTKYVKKGVLKVKKGEIWDNRYSPIDSSAAHTAAVPDSTSTAPLDRTYFAGGKNYYPGMLLRQIK